MSDLKLFRVQEGSASELRGEAATLEKALQTLIERNMTDVGSRLDLDAGSIRVATAPVR